MTISTSLTNCSPEKVVSSSPIKRKSRKSNSDNFNRSSPTKNPIVIENLHGSKSAETLQKSPRLSDTLQKSPRLSDTLQKSPRSSDSLQKSPRFKDCLTSRSKDILSSRSKDNINQNQNQRPRSNTDVSPNLSPNLSPSHSPTKKTKSPKTSFPKDNTIINNKYGIIKYDLSDNTKYEIFQLIYIDNNIYCSNLEYVTSYSFILVTRGYIGKVVSNISEHELLKNREYILYSKKWTDSIEMNRYPIYIICKISLTMAEITSIYFVLRDYINSMLKL
jgi:hypothetical protein